MSENSPLVQLSVSGALGRITFDRPAKRNAINITMADEFVRLVDDMVGKGARVAILDASGDVFSAGADLKCPQNAKAITRVGRCIADAPLPWIACVSGPVVGIAVAFVAQCMFSIASNKAWFSLPEAKSVGHFPDGVARLFPETVSVRWILEASLSGMRYSGDLAERVGLCTKVVPAGQEQSAAIGWAEQLLDLDPQVLREAVSWWRQKLPDYLGEAGG
jgi:enoyl-CoA hydratase/carnithine racemase